MGKIVVTSILPIYNIHVNPNCYSNLPYYTILYSTIIPCKVVIDLEKQDFCRRLTTLRMQKGASARDMSLSLGQSTSYINNIENGLNFPSMAVFFYICDYLGITPAEFFDVKTQNPTKVNELEALARKLSDSQLDSLISLARELAK